MDSGRLQPALYGGLLIGVLSALPLINIGNCCCCLWVLWVGCLPCTCGSRIPPMASRLRKARSSGLLAGLIGGVVGGLLSIPLQAMTSGFQQQILEWILSTNPDMPAEDPRRNGALGDRLGSSDRRRAD